MRISGVFRPPNRKEKIYKSIQQYKSYRIYQLKIFQQPKNTFRFEALDSRPLRVFEWTDDFSGKKRSKN